MFADLPPVNATTFRADADRAFDIEERFDAYDRACQADERQ
jgi:hypothetical protein